MQQVATVGPRVDPESSAWNPTSVSTETSTQSATVSKSTVRRAETAIVPRSGSIRPVEVAT